MARTLTGHRELLLNYFRAKEESTGRGRPLPQQPRYGLPRLAHGAFSQAHSGRSDGPRPMVAIFMIIDPPAGDTCEATARREDVVTTAQSLSPARRQEQTALGIFAMIAAAAIVWVIRPVGVGILLGALIAFSLQGAYEKALFRTRRPALTAVGFGLASAAGILALASGLSSLLIARGTVVAQSLITSLAPGGPLRETAQRMAKDLGPLQLKPDEFTARLHDAVADLATRAAGIAATLATLTFDVLLALFFAIITLSFVLRHWSTIARHAEDMLPLRPCHTRALLEEFQRVGRTALLGTVATGLAQGALAALGYWITGLPEPAFFGATTAVASLLPGVGTLLVWVPAGVFLAAAGHPVMAVIELAWGGLVVVGISDYVIRPRLVGGQGTMPALLTFAALFGGIEVFGLSGLVVGPLVVSVSFAVLRIFAEEASAARSLREKAQPG